MNLTSRYNRLAILGGLILAAVAYLYVPRSAPEDAQKTLAAQKAPDGKSPLYEKIKVGGYRNKWQSGCSPKYTGAITEFNAQTTRADGQRADVSGVVCHRLIGNRIVFDKQFRPLD